MRKCPMNQKIPLIFCSYTIAGDHTTGVWVGGSDNGHIGRWAWFPTGNQNLIIELNQKHKKCAILLLAKKHLKLEK